MVIISVLCLLSAVQSQTQKEARSDIKSGNVVTLIALDKPRVNDATLTWRFQIRNDSAQDAWICDAMDVVRYEAYLAEDNETLLIRRRLDLPQEVSLLGALPIGQYVRLRSGEARTELMSFPLPVLPRHVLSQDREEHPLEYATRLTLEIGYFAGDLPDMVLDILRQAEATPQPELSSETPPEERGVAYWFGGVQQFLMLNENSFYRNRSELITIPYTFRALKGEHGLRFDVNELRIPYLERDRPTPRPDLAQCTRVDVHFKTSALEFYFPHVDEQSLLSASEKQYLESLGTAVIQDQESLKHFASEVAQGLRDAFVTEHGIAELRCHHDGKNSISLTAYDCSFIMNAQGQVFRYGNRLPALRKLTPQVQALDLRAQCASQLENLWYRLRTHHKNKTYPAPKTWCDDILVSPKSGVGRQDVFIPSFRCPTRAPGKCHYAMNPSCMYNSPADVVLLFETKAGWNQHGGPELFTFDNHDPKGGLVLLNDGTVKFIRTEEELKQLRWK